MPRYLVTAGNTRELIDRVRDWGNIFTGNTGFGIARALAPLGRVDFLTSNRAHADACQSNQVPNVHASTFTSHAELKGALSALLARQSYDAIFMTAAVADYKPAGVYAVTHREGLYDGSERWTVRNVQAGKVKSTHPHIAVLGTPTEKLVDLFRTEWNHRGLLIKFKLEVGLTEDQLKAVGESSRLASGADYLVANTLDMVTGDRPGAFLLSAKGAEWIPRDALATRLAQLVSNQST